MVEDLDDLLALDHLLNIAVDVAQVPLLGHEVPAAAPAHGHDDQEHQAQREHGHQKQQRAEIEHHSHHAHKGQAVGDQIHQAVVEDLVDRLDIVGIPAHQLAVGMGVKVAEGKTLHFGEQVLPDGVGGLLGDVDHNAGIGEAEQGSADIDAGHDRQLFGQERKIAGNDTVVDEGAEHIGAADRTHGVHQQAHRHHRQQPLRPPHVAHQFTDGFSHIFGLLVAGTALSVWFRHRYSPPPAVIDRYRGRFRCPP